jgi:hypothetical protein
MLRVSGVAVVIAAALAVAASANGRYSRPIASTHELCGFERWTVKTLQDRPKLLPARATTVHFLVTRPAPRVLPTRRLPFERHIYRVTAAVTLVRDEADGDLHLALRAGSDHMIAEAPSPACTMRAKPLRRQQMAQARAAVETCTHATLTGVAFFDYKHG